MCVGGTNGWRGYYENLYASERDSRPGQALVTTHELLGTEFHSEETQGGHGSCRDSDLPGQGSSVLEWEDTEGI